MRREISLDNFMRKFILLTPPLPTSMHGVVTIFFLYIVPGKIKSDSGVMADIGIY